MGCSFTLSHGKWATKTQQLHRRRGAVFYCRELAVLVTRLSVYILTASRFHLKWFCQRTEEKIYAVMRESDGKGIDAFTP